MADITYPPDLPKSFAADSITVTPISNVISTSMATGPAKRRRRDVVQLYTVSGTQLMTYEQFTLFEEFYSTILGDGVVDFNWNHPIFLTRPMVFYFDHSQTPYQPAVVDHCGTMVFVTLKLIMRSA